MTSFTKSNCSGSKFLKVIIVRALLVFIFFFNLQTGHNCSTKNRKKRICSVMSLKSSKSHECNYSAKKMLHYLESSMFNNSLSEQRHHSCLRSRKERTDQAGIVCFFRLLYALATRSEAILTMF